MTSIYFLLTTSLVDQTHLTWEWRNWSPKMKRFDVQQILLTSTIRNIWGTVRRICMLLLGLQGLTKPLYRLNCCRWIRRCVPFSGYKRTALVTTSAVKTPFELSFKVVLYPKSEFLTYLVPSYLWLIIEFSSSSLTRGPQGGGGNSHMKVTGMLVVLLRGVNCRFWSHLGCSGQKANNFTLTGMKKEDLRKCL